jgi:hypothetical protein
MIKGKLRQDLELVDYAKGKGWSVECHGVDKDNGNVDLKGPRFPNFSLQFKKGDKVIWNALTHWVCAELNKECRYVNHRREDTLLPLLNKESNE